MSWGNFTHSPDSASSRRGSPVWGVCSPIPEECKAPQGAAGCRNCYLKPSPHLQRAQNLWAFSPPGSASPALQGAAGAGSSCAVCGAEIWGNEVRELGLTDPESRGHRKKKKKITSFGNPWEMGFYINSPHTEAPAEAPLFALAPALRAQILSRGCPSQSQGGSTAALPRTPWKQTSQRVPGVYFWDEARWQESFCFPAPGGYFSSKSFVPAGQMFPFGTRERAVFRGFRRKG